MDANDTRPLRHCPTAFIDFETTGRNPNTADIVSVCVACVELGRTTPESIFYTLVRPPVPIDPESTKIHKITDADVVNAPAWADVAPSVETLLSGRLVAAYNWPYEYQILIRTFTELPFVGLDPYVLAKHLDKFKKGKKLVDVAARRGVSLTDAHDARSDVLATLTVAPLMLREMRLPPLMSVKDYIAKQHELAIRDEQDYAAFAKRSGRPAPEMTWHRLSGAPITSF